MRDGAKVFLKNKTASKFLLQLRDNKPDIPYSNFWGSFGGGIREGEKPIDALRREIREELNIELADVEYLGAVEDVIEVGNESHQVTGHFFLAYIDYELNKINQREG
ncbi:MAG: NUDIX domain-containing protein [Patescibacteria group bacterium]